MQLPDDPIAPVHPSEPSVGFLVILACATLILATLTFLMR